MARITNEQAQKYGGSKTDWFKLPNDKDVALVQFPYTSKEEIPTLSVHELPVEGTDFTYKADCLRSLEDSVDVCPLCAAGYTPKSTVILQVYNHNTGKVEFWERTARWVEQKVIFYMDTYGEEDFNYRVFQVQRLGPRGDLQTKYEFALMDRVDPVSWEELELPDPVGTVVRATDYGSMCTYIETGKWPDENGAQSTAPARPVAAPRPAMPAARRPAPAARTAQPPVARPAVAPQPVAAPPAAAVRRAPTATSAPVGNSRTSRTVQGGGEEQF